MGHRHSHLRVYERQSELFPHRNFGTVYSARRSFFSVRNLSSRHNDTESVAIAADFDDWPKRALAKRQYASASTTRLPSHSFSDGHTFSEGAKKDIIKEEARSSPEIEPKSLRTKYRADSGTAEDILPLELLEADRQQKQHQAMKRLFQTNFQAPVHATLNGESGESGMVLEVMCGQGTWTLDMANDFPTTMFFGVHTSRTYPTTDFPANCFFQEGTPLETRGLPFCDNTFDYVIQRFTLTELSPDQRERNLKELMRVTKPGGYIEVVEADVPDVRLV
ncbi:hypothetical protein BC937DRAFT_92380 [Endogone sp. FLAS-F59071]|nr:hypothetical protein BC937DRAFT_92380 [Endogone sp. FLAS-F59071]|eukprot:RUS15491.1 hypothetical protein BC937DRAFT_92380 [Endogone sp. FLAS-F59071]